MLAYIVLTEDFYGGEDDINIFTNKEDAEIYAGIMSEQRKCAVIERPLPSDNAIIYLVVTEAWFGGETFDGQDKIQVFKTEEEAEDYQYIINDHGETDTLVLTKYIMVTE